jgi:hypothetical protein
MPQPPGFSPPAALPKTVFTPAQVKKIIMPLGDLVPKTAEAQLSQAR